MDDWRLTDRLHAQHGKGDPFAAAMRATRMSMLITDPRKEDNPIVYCNDAFLKLTGYERDEVVGRNCRFLQGPDTDPAARREIRDAIAARTDISIDILNYRRDGSSFWNALYISPVIDEAGELLFYFASQLDVTDRKDWEERVKADKDRFERAVKQRTTELEEALATQTTLVNEIDHRVKNNLQMVASLIVMQARTIPDPAIRGSLQAMLARVEALSTVHRRLYQTKDVTSFDVARFVHDLVTDLISAFGSDRIRTALDLEPVSVPSDKAAPIALMVNELVTNALKHAFIGGRNGTIGVRVGQPDGKLRIEISDDGDGMNGTPAAGTFGLKLVNSLARQLHADVEWSNAGPGTLVTIEIAPENLRPSQSAPEPAEQEG
jgi:PAS domain S-box-containing protein